MASISCTARSARLKGFSLVELSVVVAILSVVVTFGLEAAASFVNKTATATTRERLAVIDDAVDKFFRQYGRLPCPADRTQSSITAGLDGRENCTLATTITISPTNIGGGLIYGSVPFYTLNLPKVYGTDGYGSKIAYVATINLLASGGSTTIANRFGSSGFASSASNGTGAIEVRTGKLQQPCTSLCQVVANPAASPPSGAAYFLFSHGADQRGAYNRNGTSLKTCATATDSRVDTQNCVYGASAISNAMSVTTIPYNVFYDNRLNAGLNPVSYFDDIAVWRTKAQL